MSQRDKARDTAGRSSLQEVWAIYKTLRNTCTARVKLDRSNNLKETYEKLQKNNDSRGLYNLTKKKMGWKNCQTPKSFLVNGKLETSPKKLANIQSEFFHNKVKSLINKLTPQTKDPLSSLRAAMRKWGKSDSITELVLKHVTEVEVVSLIKDMGQSRAFGHKGIDSESLKAAPEAIAAPIAAMINKSIDSKKVSQ